MISSVLILQFISPNLQQNVIWVHPTEVCMNEVVFWIPYLPFVNYIWRSHSLKK